MTDETTDRRGREPFPAASRIDGERDRFGDRIDRLEDDRAAGPLPAVDRAAIERAAVDVPDGSAASEREIVVRTGLPRAAEHRADSALGVGEHRGRPRGPAEETAGLGIFEPAGDRREIFCRQLAQRDTRSRRTVVAGHLRRCHRSPPAGPSAAARPLSSSRASASVAYPYIRTIRPSWTSATTKRSARGIRSASVSGSSPMW
jgi:hypothetical protein